MSTLNVYFSAIDSWLFKPALSPDGMGARLLVSDFPPPRTTLVGALRSAIGERLGARWPEYRAGRQPDIEAAIGRTDEPHPPGAAVAGPWLSWKAEKLIPLPLCFLARETETGELEVAALTLTQAACRTDLGERRLPRLPEPLAGKGFRARSDIWLTETVLASLSALVGTADVRYLQPGEFFTRSDLFVHDDRLGIGMARERRAVEEGLLYQTRHVRLRDEVALMLQVRNWPEARKAHDQMVTLGADGRLAHVSVSETDRNWTTSCDGQALVVASAPMPMQAGGLPEAIPAPQVISAATGKPWRRGGWDLKHHRSKPVSLWVAPGSSYWLSLDAPLTLSPDFYCFTYPN